MRWTCEMRLCCTNQCLYVFSAYVESIGYPTVVNRDGCIACEITTAYVYSKECKTKQNKTIGKRIPVRYRANIGGKQSISLTSTTEKPLSHISISTSMSELLCLCEWCVWCLSLLLSLSLSSSAALSTSRLFFLSLLLAMGASLRLEACRLGG